MLSCALRSERRCRVDKRSFALILLILVTALSVVGLRHQSRQSFAELQALRAEHDQLNIEWGRLLLEQGAWSQHQRVEKIARSRLAMQLPDSSQVVVIDTQGQLAMGGVNR